MRSTAKELQVILFFSEIRRPGTLLLLAVLLSLVGSIPSGEAGLTANRTLILNSGTRNRYFQSRLTAINKLLIGGHPAQAIPLFQAAYKEAVSSNNGKYQRIFLSNLGASEFILSHYPQALSAFLAARNISERRGEDSPLVGLNTNLSSLYLQMNNLEDARTAAEQGLRVMQRMDEREVHPKLLIQLATVLSKKGDLRTAERYFVQGISQASNLSEWATETVGLDFLGDQYRLEKRFPEAESALTEGFRLRKTLHLPEIESSYRNLARLRADQGDLRSAGTLLDLAVDSVRNSRSLVAIWSLYYERGRIRQRQARPEEALADFRTALQYAHDWRASAIPTDDNRVGLETGLQPIYSALIDTANCLYLKTGDPALARESFNATEENRAASLRALVPRMDDWRAKLPPQYWELLPEYLAARRKLQASPDSDLARKTQELRAALSEIEFSAGSKNGITDENAFANTQGALDDDSVLLSFHVGDSQSWLWAITSNQFALYRLAGRAEIAAQIRRANTALHGDVPAVRAEGESLYRILFSQLDDSFRKQRWLLSLDEDLYSVPFPALVDAGKGNRSPAFLGEIHEIQTTSGALMLQPRRRTPDLAPRFIGVGDAIYNAADPRWHGRNTASRAQVARLPGTARELQACARIWSHSAEPAVLLTGVDANKRKFWGSLTGKPAVIHFATHVFEEDGSGAIALSLANSGEAEYLTAAEIIPQSIAASLIVLSGCGSGKAEVLPGAGLMGLTRAWIGAGALAVLATGRATLDDSGPFLVSFYRHLRQSPAEGQAAALRAARRDMIRSGSYQARPEYWSAYFLVGNS